MCENCKEEKQVNAKKNTANKDKAVGKVVDERFKEYEGIKGAEKIYKELGSFPKDDLTGMKFERLTVIKPVGTNNKGQVLWLCECECSNKVIIAAYSLKNFDIKSCGCLRVDKAKRFKDLTGMKFGRLAVIRRVENRGNQIYYECLCECGNTVIVRGSHLKHGLIQSCKCLNKEVVHKKFFKDLTGQRIGRLVITGIAKRVKVNGDYDTYYNATCDCGNKIVIKGAYLCGKRRTQSCGCLHKEVTSKNKLDDLTGRKFGELTVIKRVENTPGGETRFLCSCSCGSLINVTAPRLKAGQKSCGCIKSKGEYKIANILKENNISFLKQKEFDDIKGALPKGVFKFDFYIEDKYLVEYDGSQHFKPSSKGWNDEEHFKNTQRRDEAKNNYCREKEIPLIRIPYTHLENICLEDLKLETTKFRVV